MTIVSLIILLFAAMQLIVALANYLFKQELPQQFSQDQLVSVCIPARNEEKNIATLLTDLQNQNYRQLEILVFDDQSDDATASIVKAFAETDPRIQLFRSAGLPPGWLGKNWGCHSLAREAKGQWLLFLDADVRIADDIIGQSVAGGSKQRLKLLTIFPAQIMESPGEKITVPNMHYILLTLLPLSLVKNSSFPSLAAANGQFMLFEAASYHQTLPHEKVKNNKVEDIEIARMYKQLKAKVACLTGFRSISCRMYHNFGEAVNGFSKNVAHFFGNSLLLATLFWTITTFGFIPLLFRMGMNLTLVWLLFILITRMLVSLTSRQPVWQNLLLMPLQQVALGFFIGKALINRIKKEYLWKGRKI